MAAALAAATLLCGCGVPVSPLAISGADAGAANVKRGGSWMMPGAKNQPSLLYVSNQGTTDVTVYTYSDGGGLLLVGQLTGFVLPAGMCTDKAGDVWITDYGSGVKTLYEYPHGGTSPIETLKQYNGRPYDCAVDLQSGDLAVANELPNGKLTFASVAVYAPGAHKANHYAPPYGFRMVDFLAYDDKSNLYVDGTELYLRRKLFELHKGGDILRQVALKGAKLEEPGAIQWINPTLLVGDDNFENRGVSGAYKVVVSKLTATVVGSLSFHGTKSAGAFWRRADHIVVPDAGRNAVRIYNLSDGSLYATLTRGISRPFGAVVSQAP